MDEPKKKRKPTIKKIPDEKVEVLKAQTQRMGRPDAYDPAFCELVEELGAKGKSFTQIAVTLGVTRQTLHNWSRRYPEFFDAMVRAKEAAQAYFETIGDAQLMNGEFDYQVWNKFLTSRFPQEYGKETVPEFVQVIEQQQDKPKKLDLSVVEPEYREIVLNALMLMKQAAEEQEEDDA